MENCDPEWGILVHQLPRELMGSAMRVLPMRYIRHKLIDTSGMRVYFSMKETADELICRKNITVDGIFYNVFPLVTCLTVYGIKAFASRDIIKAHFIRNGMDVSNLYQMSNTEEYRVILDVPEVLANFERLPILLPSNPDNKFQMDFYCRVCRKEGHKQYQCPGPESSAGSQAACDSGGESARRRSQTPVTGTGNSIQGNDMTRSVPGVHDTRSQGNYNRTSDVLARQQNVDVLQPDIEPSTSSTPKAAERLTRTPTIQRNRVARGARRITKRVRKQFPCKEIVKIIRRVKGILTPQVLLSFLNVVHCKKDVVKYAKDYTCDFPALVQQIREIVSRYNQQSSRRSIGNTDIKSLERLCSRLSS